MSAGHQHTASGGRVEVVRAAFDQKASYHRTQEGRTGVLQSFLMMASSSDEEVDARDKAAAEHEKVQFLPASYH